MRIGNDAGTIRLGPHREHPAPWTLAVEASGAVLTWPLDATDQAEPTVTITNLTEADWLWRWLGAEVHAHILEHADDLNGDIEPAGDPDILRDLRQLAYLHWLWAWWPASAIDQIPTLDDKALTTEIAVRAEALDAVVGLTADPVAMLQAIPPSALASLLACETSREIAEQAIAILSDVDAEALPIPRRRAAYALAAGATRAPEVDGPLARGRAPLAWQSVPGGIFDATEFPVEWTVDAAPEVRIDVTVALQNPPRCDPSGIPVAVDIDGVHQDGRLDGTGSVSLPLALDAAAAWRQDWAALAVTVGVPVAEDATLRASVRDMARCRLARPDRWTSVAERLVLEEDF